MCGIFATSRPDLWRPLMGDVLSALHHRGPDASGTWESPGGEVLFCHTRLSIVGLGAEGAQPAVLAGGEALTFNGEIYNFRDLAPGLGPEAMVSDTQVVVRSIARDGLAAVNRFRGMYAFAYWDPEARSLSAVRDPWGIKPLYLLDHPGGGVTLSSEIGPLLLHPDGLEADPIGIAQYLSFGHTLPQFTCRRRIRKLNPGVIYTWSLAGDRQVDLATRAVEQVTPNQGGEVDDALADSVRAHLVSDVEVGVFLSGGIDSTLITALAVGIEPQMHAYTLSFPETPAMDESPLAAANASALAVKHTIVPVTSQRMLDALDGLLAVTGEPFGDAAALPLSVLARRAARDLKVVLTGEGADELFGGYARYRVSRVLPRRSIPGLSWASGHAADLVYDRRGDRPVSRSVEALLRLDGRRSHAALVGSDLPAIVRTSAVGEEVEALLRTDWEAHTAGRRGREAARRFDLTRWLPNTYLEKTDRATMAASIEARTPFLDPVVASAARRGGHPFGKARLHRALLDRLPDAQLPERKKGLAVSIDRLLALSLGDDLARMVGSHQSILATSLGVPTVKALAARAERSPLTAYRLAVLGRWEALTRVA